MLQLLAAWYARTDSPQPAETRPTQNPALKQSIEKIEELFTEVEVHWNVWFQVGSDCKTPVARQNFDLVFKAEKKKVDQKISRLVRFLKSNGLDQQQTNNEPQLVKFYTFVAKLNKIYAKYGENQINI